MSDADKGSRKAAAGVDERDIETEPLRLDCRPSRADRKTFLGVVANFFRGNADVQLRESIGVAPPAHPVEQVARCEELPEKSTLYRHWNAIKAEGITASQFIAFVQPLADLDGITVSYSYSDSEGVEHVYNRRSGEIGSSNPLSRAIQERKLTKEKALTFALNEEGRVWIESNFIDLNDLK